MGVKARVEPVDGDGLVYFDKEYCDVYYQPKQSTEWTRLPLPPVVLKYHMVTESSKVFLISGDGKNRNVYVFDLINANNHWKRVANVPILKTDRALVAASHGEIHMIAKITDLENMDGNLLTYNIAENSWSYILYQSKRPIGLGSIALFIKGRPLTLLGSVARVIEVVDKSGKFWVRNNRMGKLLRRNINYRRFDVSTEFFFERWTIAEYDIEKDEVTGRFACKIYTNLMIAIMGSWFDGRVLRFRVHETIAVLTVQYKGKQLVFKGTLNLTKRMVNWEQTALPERQPREETAAPQRTPIIVHEATDIRSHLSSAWTASESFDSGLICRARNGIYYQSKQDSTLDCWIQLPKLPVPGQIVYAKKKLFLLEKKGSTGFHMFNMMDLGKESAAWCKVADMPSSKPKGFEFLKASDGKVYVIPVAGHAIEIYDIKSNSWKVTPCKLSVWLGEYPGWMTLMFDGRPLILRHDNWNDNYWLVRLLHDSGDFWLRPELDICRWMLLSTHVHDISSKFYCSNWDIKEYDMLADKTGRTFHGFSVDWKVLFEVSRNGRRSFLQVQGTKALALFSYKGRTVAFEGDMDAHLGRVTWRLVALPPGAFEVIRT